MWIRLRVPLARAGRRAVTALSSRTLYPLPLHFPASGAASLATAPVVASGATLPEADPAALPLSADEFASAMENLLGGLDVWKEELGKESVTVCVAVSGGPDSMALAALLQEWALARGNIRVAALSVDHRLREESGAELDIAASQLRSLGIASIARCVDWGDSAPASRIVESARRHRYALLADMCKEAGSRLLFVAHHLNDQVETFLHRLTRRSGLQGLSAMQPVTPHAQGMLILRPLLTIPKARILATSVDRGLHWVVDPSNTNPVYDRSRIREALDAMEQRGITVARLANLVAHIDAARSLMDSTVNSLIHRGVMVKEAGGYAVLLPHCLCSPDVLPELSVRALARILTVFGGRDRPPGLATLQHLFEEMVARPHNLSFASSGCLIMTAKKRRTYRNPDGSVAKFPKVVREPPRLLAVREAPVDRLCRPGDRAGDPITPGQTILWDNRFRISCVAVGPCTPFRICRFNRAEFDRLFQLKPDLRYLFHKTLPDTMYGVPMIIADAPDEATGFVRDPVANVVAVPHLRYCELSNVRFELEWHPQKQLVACFSDL